MANYIFRGARKYNFVKEQIYITPAGKNDQRGVNMDWWYLPIKTAYGYVQISNSP